MENIEQRVRKIVAEQLGVNEAEIKNESSFTSIFYIWSFSSGSCSIKQ